MCPAHSLPRGTEYSIYMFILSICYFKILIKVSTNWVKWCHHLKLVAMSYPHSKHPLLMRAGEIIMPSPQIQKNQGKGFDGWIGSIWKGENVNLLSLSLLLNCGNGLSLGALSLISSLHPSATCLLSSTLQFQPGSGKGMQGTMHMIGTP